MKLSIVIICWNDKDVIDDCLRSIFDTVRETEFEVIVSDNGSTDESCDLIRRDHPAVRIINNGANIGFARGNGPGDEEAESVALTPETPICLFSSSKAFAAMLVHLLSERKLVSLLDPVSYEFGLNFTLERVDGAGAPLLVKDIDGGDINNRPFRTFSHLHPFFEIQDEFVDLPPGDYALTIDADSGGLDAGYEFRITDVQDATPLMLNTARRNFRLTAIPNQSQALVTGGWDVDQQGNIIYLDSVELYSR